MLGSSYSIRVMKDAKKFSKEQHLLVGGCLFLTLKLVASYVHLLVHAPLPS